MALIFSYDRIAYKGEEYRAGQAVQMFADGNAFNSAVVLGFAYTTDAWYVKLARPYCMASGTGTTGPTALVGVEEVVVAMDRFCQMHREAGTFVT